MTPRATYRLQLHRGFTLDDAAAVVPYLARLGISHAYTSPILKARAGSTHGYDVVDPRVVNPELGGEEALRRLVTRLRAHEMGLVIDIVPNHMAVGGADNPWWLDVIEHGRDSRYATFFDIDWDTPDEALRGKLLLPFLGGLYGEVLAAGELRLADDPDLHRIAVAYHDHRFPIRPEDAAAIRAEMERDGPGVLERWSEPDRLHELLERQHFRLAWWRVAGDEINYRRFFEITGLAGLRVEEAEVFEAVHATIFRLYAEGQVDGLRIDHVDGLADPGGYCRRLRRRLSELAPLRPEGTPPGRAWIVVEKILAPHESVPDGWEVDGTTGYEFMNEVSALLHDPTGEEPLDKLWFAVSGRDPDFELEERAAREELLDLAFAGQLDAAARAFHELARARPETRGYTFHALRRALRTLLSVFPAYRIYARGQPVGSLSQETLKLALDKARPLAPAGEDMIVDFVADHLAGRGEGDPDAIRLALTRFQQLSAPLAAKAVEDTAFYRYGRLLSRTDVGFDAARLAMAPEAFHETCRIRSERAPATLITTATHDHKRGEDVRARLAVLSEIVPRWGEATQRWFDLAAATAGDAVHPADLYQLFQTLVGAWPLDLEPDDRDGMAAFSKRMADWQEKALREAKLRSSWTAPDTAYEADARALTETLLSPDGGSGLPTSVADFVARIAPAAALNGLTQLFLRLTTPGVPDCYQGTEYWDLSLVDPDNRRPVDFECRDRMLAAPGMQGEAATDWAALLADWRSGRVKQALLARLLDLRAALPDLFALGAYRPLETSGRHGDRLLAFLRTHGPDLRLFAATRLAAEPLLKADAPLPKSRWWGNTAVELPEALAGGRFIDELTGATIDAADGLPARALFAVLPVAVLAPAPAEIAPEG